MKLSRIVVCLIACTTLSSAFAEPAPWYLWRSKLNGKTFCQQTSPGEGWERVGGPFKDGRCSQSM